jgi:hypothetical protein
LIGNRYMIASPVQSALNLDWLIELNESDNSPESPGLSSR